jgi:capsular exopolysaccharide synthesis family protein
MTTTIDFYCSESQVMNDSIDRIIVELHAFNIKNNSKSILFSGCGTKSGTTTIAINLAIALSLSGWKTLLVDCDLRKLTKYKRLNEKTEIGFSDYLSRKLKKEEVIYKTNYKNLEYIPSGTIANNPVRLLCSAMVDEFMSQVKEGYDYILFDFPSLNIVSDANIFFPYVDGIALVAALKQTTKRQLKDARRKVMEYQDKYYGLIINQVDMSQYKKYIKDYDYFGEHNMLKRYKASLKAKSKKVKW